MTKTEIINYMYDNNVKGDYTIEQIAEDLCTPQGWWIEDTEQSAKHIEKIYVCSNCHNFEAWGETELYNYCPNCGAKMEEVMPNDRGTN